MIVKYLIKNMNYMSTFKILLILQLNLVFESNLT